jgi:malate synthase
MESNFKITAAHHYPEIFSEELVKFLIHLHKKFNDKRIELLEQRKKVQEMINQGIMPAFPKETRGIREDYWTCSKLPNDLKNILLYFIIINHLLLEYL